MSRGRLPINLATVSHLLQLKSRARGAVKTFYCFFFKESLVHGRQFRILENNDCPPAGWETKGIEMTSMMAAAAASNSIIKMTIAK